MRPVLCSVGVLIAQAGGWGWGVVVTPSLTRPQSAGNPISEELSFKAFLWEDALGPPNRELSSPVHISNPLLYNPMSDPTQYSWVQYSGLLDVTYVYG